MTSFVSEKAVGTSDKAAGYKGHVPHDGGSASVLQHYYTYIINCVLLLHLRPGRYIRDSLRARCSVFV
jgi:hypothetical protein